MCSRQLYCPECPQKSVGNPITLGSGDKTLTESDYTGAGPFPLRIARHYNAQGAPLALGDSNPLTLPLGRGWRLHYHRSLTAYSSPVLSLVTLKRETGLTRSFKLESGNVLANAFEKGKLERLTDGGGALAGWRYRTADDEIEAYSATGQLQSITNRAGLTQTLAYDAAGSLASVTDPYGRQLQFTYRPDGQISSITAPGGLVFSYAYTGGSALEVVTYPDATTRRYHYEVPTFPLGRDRHHG